MQDTEKQLNGIIDLTQNFTIGAKKKYDSNFHPDSPEYYFFEVSDEDKLEIFFEKVNKIDKYYRYSSLEHVVETIFNSSEAKLYYKKKEIDNFLNVFPELKEQKIAELKLDTYNKNRIINFGLENELQLSKPTDEGILDFESAKHVFVTDVVAIFLSLGGRSVEDISNYLLLIIEYRANLLFINYLIELSLPPATKKAEVKSIKKMNENDRLIKECFDKHLKDKKGNETLALTITVREITNKSDDVVLIKKETTRIRQALVRMGIWKGKKAT